MHKKPLSLAIVIPAYNEERHIGACLDSIAAQTIKPAEVIVVDNNSSDKTAQIARSYDFVTVVSEKTPGLIAARNAGFNHARSDVLGRINADVVLDKNWVKQGISDFGGNPPIDGLTGLARTKLLPSLPYGYTTFWTRIYLAMSDAYFGVRMMWGANMMISRTAWLSIKDKTQTVDNLVHEDQDLSLLLAASGRQIFQDARVLVTTNEQSYQYWPKLKFYIRKRWRTKAVHKTHGSYSSPQLVNMPSAARFAIGLIALPASIIFVGYSFAAYRLERLWHLLLRSRI